MKKVFKIVLLFIIPIIIVIAILELNKYEYFNNKTYNSLVYVKGEDESTSKKGCGFVYKTIGDKAYILTNYHIIEGYYEISIKSISGEEIPGRVIYFDDRNDYAIIEVNNVINLKEITIGSSSNLSSNLKTIVVDKQGKYYKVGHGKFIEYIQMNDFDMDFSAIKTNIKINYGNSGSPLFNNVGEVIGVIFIKDDNTDEALAIPIDFIINNVGNENSRRISLGGTFASTNDYETLEKYGIYSDISIGVVVLNIDTNGIMYKKGLKKGDIIVEFNNKKIENIQDLKSEIDNIKDYNSIKIRYYRDKKYYEVYLSE